MKSKVVSLHLRTTLRPCMVLMVCCFVGERLVRGW